jgi:hypothetical protein
MALVPSVIRAKFAEAPRARKHPWLALWVLAAESLLGIVFGIATTQTLKSIARNPPGGLPALTRDGAHDLVNVLLTNPNVTPQLTLLFGSLCLLMLLARPYLTLAYLGGLLGARARLIPARAAFLFGRAAAIVALTTLLQWGLAGGLLLSGAGVATHFAVSWGEPSADRYGVALALTGLPLLCAAAIWRDASLASLARGRLGTALALRTGFRMLWQHKLRVAGMFAFYNLMGGCAFALLAALSVRSASIAALAFVLRRAALAALGVWRLAWLAALQRRVVAPPRPL